MVLFVVGVPGNGTAYRHGKRFVASMVDTVDTDSEPDTHPVHGWGAFVKGSDGGRIKRERKEARRACFQ